MLPSSAKRWDGPLEVTIDMEDSEIFYRTIALKLAACTAISECEDYRKRCCNRESNMPST